jgi:uncharacterized membrane protein YkvA (DUF1232 family)
MWEVEITRHQRNYDVHISTTTGKIVNVHVGRPDSGERRGSARAVLGMGSMWGSWWLDLLLGVAAGLVLAWLALLVALIIARPRGGLLREALRLLPDLLRLLPRLAADRSLPRGVRAGLAALLGYLAFPFDLVPDFIPVLGYADDAIIVAAVLRWVVRRAGIDAVRGQWPGTEDGFTALCRLTGLTPRDGSSSSAVRLP